jgi:hypothetical protein
LCNNLEGHSHNKIESLSKPVFNHFIHAPHGPYERCTAFATKSASATSPSSVTSWLGAAITAVAADLQAAYYRLVCVELKRIQIYWRMLLKKVL